MSAFGVPFQPVDATHPPGLEYGQPLRYFLVPQLDMPAVETMVSFSTSVINPVATNFSLF